MTNEPNAAIAFSLTNAISPVDKSNYAVPMQPFEIDAHVSQLNEQKFMKDGGHNVKQVMNEGRMNSQKKKQKLIFNSKKLND